MHFTAREIVEILETPVGDGGLLHTAEINEQRKAIMRRYSDLSKCLSFSEASLRARTEWLQHFNWPT